MLNQLLLIDLFSLTKNYNLEEKRLTKKKMLGSKDKAR